MARHYKILAKANLAGDLFDVPASLDESLLADDEALAHRQAAQALREAELFPREPTEDAEPAAQPVADLIAADPALDAALGIALQAATPAPQAAQCTDWRQALLAATGGSGAADSWRLGLVSLQDRGIAATALAVGRWMARHADKPALLVEADWRNSALARTLQRSRRGLAEALADPDIRVESLIHDEVFPGLAVLPAGGAAAFPGRAIG